MSTVTDTEPIIQVGQTLQSSSATYSILELIGQGGFGKVAKCQNLQTGETVAIKVLKKNPNTIQDTEHEVSILKMISELKPEPNNIVKFFEHFDHLVYTCLAFEMLEANLYDLFENNNWEPVHLRGIRPIAKQLFTALAALKTLGILHTDIKLDNIMIVKEQEEAIRIKIIDFGLAIPANKVQPGMVCQPIGYRAPEVSIGLPITEAVDIWGVGCVLAFLYLAQNLFSVFSEYRMMKHMVEILGQPPDHLLWNGGYTRKLFALEETLYYQTWRLQTPEEYAQKNGVDAEELDTSFILPIKSLDDMMTVYPQSHAGETEDTKAFVDLMKGLLHLDGTRRLTAHQALQHPFVSMSHLNQREDFSDYFSKSQVKMRNCQNTGMVTGPQGDTDFWNSLHLDEVTDQQTDENEIPSDSGWVENSWTDKNEIPSDSGWVENSWCLDGHKSVNSFHENARSWNLDDDKSDQSDQSGNPDWDNDSQFPDEPQPDASIFQSAESLDHADRHFNDDHPEVTKNLSLNNDEETHDDQPEVTNSAAITNTSSRSLKKRLVRFFKSLKRRCCCCVSPVED